MDKGQLPAENLMNPESRVDDGNSKDDVAVTAKKEKLQELLALNDSIPTPTNIVIHANKTHSRGKDSNDKKQDVKAVHEQVDTEELLGSVTTYNCHGTRTSARVIQKMRQDLQTRPVTPPPAERDLGRKDERSANQKTPSQVRANRPTWSNIERNHFFDALNEFGKDFESIGNFINTKLKRRSPTTDNSFKSKDQVRQHYYQTYHKICKYIRFSEEIRKPAQELYALINYGEMRRKLQFVSDKHFVKLRNLIYHGHISVRCKGKNIRIKTPSCKALRRLNQLDDSLEDIRLPSKIEVIISPANMEAFGHVQTIAQNPRCRTTVPLHKKLINFIKTFQHKWRSMDVRIAEETKLLSTQDSSNAHQQTPNTPLNDLGVHDGEMCFLPKPGVTIHRPLLSITEYLSSVNICLTAYEERMGVKVKGEHLNTEKCTPAAVNNASTNVQSSTCNQNISTNNKRLRTESGSEKRSPEQLKKTKQMGNADDILTATAEDVQLLNNSSQSAKTENSSDELSDEIQELLSDCNEVNNSKEQQSVTENINPPPPPPPPIPSTTSTENTSIHCTSHFNTGARSKRSIGNKTSRSVFKPLLNDDVIQRIRSGWTSSTAGDITMGDLYVVFGHDSKLQLDYYWMPLESKGTLVSKSESHSSNVLKQNFLGTSKQTANYSNSSYYEGKLQRSVQSSDLSSKLKQLLLIANLSDRMRRRPCICDRNNAAKSKFERDLNNRTFIANKPFIRNGIINSAANDTTGNVFRQPMIPVRRTSIDPVKQLTTLTRQKMSRQVLVQRLLLPSTGSGAKPVGQPSSNIIQTSTPATSTAMPSNITTVKNNEVPWNQADICDAQLTTSVSITTPTIITTVASNQQPQNECAYNTTFLNTLIPNDFEEMPQTSSLLSSSHYPQPFKDFEDQNVDKTDGSPSNIPSVDSAFDENSNTSFLNGLSPTHLLRDTSSNSKWLEENINDFSLTSLLGHLDEINSSRDMLDPSSNLSVISESSVDYMHKFQEIKALLQSQEKD